MSSPGAPIGNQNAVKGKRWQQAIDRALARRSRSDAIAELDKLADEFLDAVRSEGITGFRELGDRLDGRPTQQLDHGNADGKPFFVRFDSLDGDA